MTLEEYYIEVNKVGQLINEEYAVADLDISIGEYLFFNEEKYKKMYDDLETQLNPQDLKIVLEREGRWNRKVASSFL